MLLSRVMIDIMHTCKKKSQNVEGSPSNSWATAQEIRLNFYLQIFLPERNHHCEKNNFNSTYILKNSPPQTKSTPKKHSSSGLYFCSRGNQHSLPYSNTFCLLSSLVYKVTSSTQLFPFFPVFPPKVTLNYFKTPSLKKWFNNHCCKPWKCKSC